MWCNNWFSWFAAPDDSGEWAGLDADMLQLL